MANNKIKKLRLAKNFSQEMLAEKANVSVRTIQRLEAGDDTSIETLNLVAAALEVSIKDLFDDPATSNQAEKIQDADEQLQYQLTMRHREYQTFTHLYAGVYVVIMLIIAMALNLADHLGDWGTMLGVCWIGGWILMPGLKSYLVIKTIDPKLDQKYPLTKHRIDKDKEPKAK